MKVLFPLLFVLLLIACGENKSTENAVKDPPAVVDIPTEKEPEIPDTLKSQFIKTGSYVGDFEAVEYDYGKTPSYSNRINISIDEVQKETIKGHSVVAGNIRPFEGTITARNNQYEVHAEEPGDDRYDGVFDFKIDPKKNEIKGTWTANDKKLAVTERKYTLQYQAFEYDAKNQLPVDVEWRSLYDNQENIDAMEGEFLTEDVTKLNASTQLLTKKDLENMYKGDLEVIRNAIYARHGYSFKNRKMRYVFDNNIDWYVPIATDIRKDLTEIERKNIDLLKRYEEHAVQYYDVFGR